MSTAPLTPPNIKVPVLDQTGKFTPFWFDFFKNIAQFLNPAVGDVAVLKTTVSTLSADIAAGLTVVIPTAKLTALGSNGSMTFTHGILTGHTDAT